MLNKLRKGQTMVEYIIIVSLIAIACIAAFTLFGDKIKDKVNNAADKVEELPEG